MQKFCREVCGHRLGQPDDDVLARNFTIKFHEGYSNLQMFGG